MSNGEEPARPGSYASLDARVRDLEKTVALMARDFAHLGETIDTRLRMIEATITNTAAGVARIDAFIQKAMLDPYSVMPRSASEEREEWESWRRTVDADRQSFREQRYQITGAWRLIGLAFLSAGALAAIIRAALDAVTIYQGHP